VATQKSAPASQEERAFGPPSGCFPSTRPGRRKSTSWRFYVRTRTNFMRPRIRAPAENIRKSPVRSRRRTYPMISTYTRSNGRPRRSFGISMDTVLRRRELRMTCTSRCIFWSISPWAALARRARCFNDVSGRIPYRTNSRISTPAHPLRNAMRLSPSLLTSIAFTQAQPLQRAHSKEQSDVILMLPCAGKRRLIM